jgi:ketosteroid isomerase-like protein
MPSPTVIDLFLQTVEAGQAVEAIRRFYAEHATMQENQSEPRRGKAALLRHEERAQAAALNPRARCLRPVLVEGDIVVIRWVFEYETRSGQSVRFEELAYQRWEGEFIAEEQFFYDPAQFTPR